MAEILIVIWVLTWMVKTATTDVVYSLRGQTPPRHRERMARIETGSSEQRRYGIRGWATDLWDDGLRANTEWRRRKKAEARKQTPVDDMIDVAQVRPNPAPKPEPEPEAKPESATKTDGASCNRCPYGRIVGTRPWPGEPGSSPDADRLCDRCGWQSARFTGKTLDERAREWDRSTPTTGPAPQQTAPAVKTPAPTTGRVIPFPNREEKSMSNIPPNGTGVVEVTGLQSAIAYADGVARAHSAHSTAGGESYIGSLQSFNVTGNTITLVAQAQEASALAAASWEAAAKALRDQLVVKEAYDANPDAGSQAFVQGE